MSCTKCKTDICKCGKSALPVMPPSGCNTPDCASPEPCSEVVSMACIQFIGEDKTCGEETVYTLGDNIAEVHAKIVDFFCSKISTSTEAPLTVTCGLDTVYSGGDTITVALKKVTDYFCAKFSDTTLMPDTIMCGGVEVVDAGDSIIVALEKVILHFCTAISGLNTVPTDVLCGLDVVYNEGDTLLEALEKVNNYYCNKIADATIIPADKVCGETTVYAQDDTVIEAVGKLADYVCDQFANLDTLTYNEVTHAELVALIGANTLQAGEHYKITDFQTIYPQPDYSDPTTPKAEIDWVIKTAGIEELVVLATSNNTITKEAWSIDFPHDSIEYDYRVETYNTVPTKGKITRRKDSVGNDFPFDFRNVQFKRYKLTALSSDFTEHWDTTFASAEFYTLEGYTPLVADNKNDPTSYQSFYQNNVATLNFVSEDNHSTGSEVFDIWAFNTILRRDGSLITNNKFSGVVDNNLFINARNNVFDGVLSNNKFLSNVYENSFEGIIINTDFNGNVNSNTVRTSYISACKFNKFVANFVQASITNVNAEDSDFFRNNTINQADLSNITFIGGGDISANEFLGSTIGGSVTWGTGFNNNRLFGEFFGTDVGTGFANNTITIQFNNCTGVGNGFRYNTISYIPDGVDFSNPLAHVYQTYDCEIFRRKDGTSVLSRLRYVDDTDAIVVTDINS